MDLPCKKYPLYSRRVETIKPCRPCIFIQRRMCISIIRINRVIFLGVPCLNIQCDHNLHIYIGIQASRIFAPATVTLLHRTGVHDCKHDCLYSFMDTVKNEYHAILATTTPSAVTTSAVSRGSLPSAPVSCMRNSSLPEALLTCTVTSLATHARQQPQHESKLHSEIPKQLHLQPSSYNIIN